MTALASSENTVGLLPMSATESHYANRIAIVVGSMAAGGAERVAATLGNAWSRQGREVWIVSTYLGRQTTAYTLDSAVSTVFLSDRLKGDRRTRLRAVFWKVSALRNVLREIAPDVVVSFLTNVNVLCIAALACSRIPLIVSERVDPTGDVYLPRALRIARALSYRAADAVVVQTAAAAQRQGAQLLAHPRLEVIHNPLPRELDLAPARSSQRAAGGGRIIAMGRLAPQKGFARLIQAYKQAFADDASWTLQIWGEGPLRRDLLLLVTELHLEDRVQLCGTTRQPWPALAAAQMFVLSSEYEGFPNAMLEAMAVGLPCVAFDCPSGPRELADDGLAAIIVPPGDVAGLASALRELATNIDKRQMLGARGAAFVRQNFSEEVVMGAWDRLFDRLLIGRQRRT